MELHETLKNIVDKYGRETLRSARLLNMLADYNVSYEYPSMKFILKIMVEEGIIKTLTDEATATIDVNSCLFDLTEKYGFRSEVSSKVVNSILRALGKTECLVNVEEVKNTPNPKQPNKDSHIVFSGISLGESVADIARHLKTRGFDQKEKKSYDIIMKGEFCGIHDVRLCVLGSPHGLTRAIALHFGEEPSLLKLEYANKLFDLLKRKYGKPSKFFEKFKIIGPGMDLDYYCENILLFSEAEEKFDTLLEIEWKVEGGTIEMKWYGEAFFLSYHDALNNEYIKAHQDEFDISSI